MLALALKASEDHPLEKRGERSACRSLGFLDLFLASAVQLLLLFPPFVWNLLLFKAVIQHVQEPKPCGWSEAFDHFMMDVIQARGFAVFD